MNKETRKEINEEFSIFDYVSRKIMMRAFVVIVIFGVLFGVGGMQYKKYKTEKERDIFKQSTSYNESAASFIADAYVQYNDAESEEDQLAIMKYVRMRYPNLNASHIENATLRQFYNKCIERR